MGSLKRAVSTVKVRVDEIELGIISGSLEFGEGFPNRKVEGMDDGTVVVSEDQSTAIGMIKFSLKPTPENLRDARSLERRNAVSVAFFDDNNVERVMRSGVSKNDSTKSVGSDGKIELCFEGTPLE